MSEDTKLAAGEQVIIAHMQRDARILGVLDSATKKTEEPKKESEE